MKGFCPLASGSKGNAIYFGSGNTRILIDAGIRTKTILERLSEIGVEAETLQAIIVTHEHTDHIAGLEVLAEKLKIPVLANAETAKGIVAALGRKPKFKIFATGETFCFGDLEIHPFSVPHDTLDPVGFTIKNGALKVGICADVGHITSLVRKNLEGCDYLYIEANHQVSMVHSCARPQVYKTRVLGKQGHLSNEDCAKLLQTIYHPGLKHIHLAHLSSECNTPDVALEVAAGEMREKGIEVSIAHQDRLSKPISF